MIPTRVRKEIFGDSTVAGKACVDLPGLGLLAGMKILVVPDKFKGTLTAAEAGEAIRRGWGEYRFGDQIEVLPMSDGGDGFGAILGAMLGAERVDVPTANAAHEKIAAPWWHQAEQGIAVLETAGVIGLAMLPPGKFHPFELDTFGLGAMFASIREHKPGTCIVGIGGSATNDGGFGLARGLGYRFLNGAGQELTRWTELNRLERIVPPETDLRFKECIIASDVENPLLGLEGATRIYGPQKGIRVEDIAVAEECLGRLAEVVVRDLGVDAVEQPGTGAAGGLGYGLRVFLEGRFEAGFEIFARYARLEEKVRQADLVITAEGSIDRQSQMGKGTGAVAAICVREGKRCVGLSGTLDREALASAPKQLFNELFGMHPDLTTLEEAKGRPAHWLERLAERAARSVEG